MKIKTSELQGAALDWAVAEAIGRTVHATVHYSGVNEYGRVASSSAIDLSEFSPSTNWSQCGPLIESAGVLIGHYLDIGGWYADLEGPAVYRDGPTPLIAACRAIVAAKLGDEVDVPEELA